MPTSSICGLGQKGHVVTAASPFAAPAAGAAVVAALAAAAATAAAEAAVTLGTAPAGVPAIAQVQVLVPA